MSEATELPNIRDVDEPQKLTEWEKEPTVRDLKQNLTDAQSHHDAAVSTIAEYLDNLNIEGKAKPKAVKGSSQIQPKLIRKQAEWRYSALSEPFLSTDDIFNISPITFEDKKAAQQNQLVLNNQFNTKLNKVRLIDEYVRTAVDEGTVIARVGWDFEEETVEVEVPVYEYQVNPEAAPLHQQLAQLQATNPEQYEQETPDELKQAHQFSVEEGVPYVPVLTGSTTESQTRTVKNQPTVEICDYRNLIIDPTCKGDLEKAGFVIYSFESSKSELERDGKYKHLDKINVNNNTILGEPDHATENPTDFNFSDEARKKFVVYEYWGYWDIDGSGLVQPIVAAWVGDTLIRMEENPFPDKKIPFVAVHYLPKRRSAYGEPDGALLEDNQKVIGAVTRGMIDIMGKSANGQTGVRKDVLDVTNKRKFDNGQDYEFNSNVDPRQGIYMHTYPEIPSSAQFMLQAQNLEAESITGVKSFNQGITGAGMGENVPSVRGALDAASKRETGILRRLAAGMVAIGRKIISMNAVFLDETEVVRITNEEFVEVRKDDLAGNFDLKLTISTAEEDNAKVEKLAFMLQTVGPKVDPQITFMIMADIARLQKMPDLAQRLENYEPQPDPVQQQIQQLELQKLQWEIEKIKSEVQENMAEAMLDQAKVGTEQAKAGNLASDTDKKNLDFIEQETGVTQERDLQKQGAQANAQAQMKVLEHRLKMQEPKSTQKR